MNSDPYEEVKTDAGRTSFLSNDSTSRCKGSNRTHDVPHAPNSIKEKETARERGRDRQKERGRFFIILFFSPHRWQNTLWRCSLPPSLPRRSRFEQKVDVPELCASRLLCRPADLCVCLYTLSVSTLRQGKASCACVCVCVYVWSFCNKTVSVNICVCFWACAFVCDFCSCLTRWSRMGSCSQTCVCVCISIQVHL